MRPCHKSFRFPVIEITEDRSFFLYNQDIPDGLIGRKDDAKRKNHSNNQIDCTCT